MNRENLTLRIWWETDVPVWVEKVVLPVLAAALMALIFVNPMKFDWPQRISLFIALLAFSYFLSHTLHLRNEANRLGSVKRSSQGSSPAKVQPGSATSTINQKAEDSDCSNVVAGGDANVNCPPAEEKSNAKKSVPKSP
jgi:hypothetical protein